MNNKKNLLLISLDTVRADVAYNGSFPGIESLREHGVSFLNSVAPAPLTPISHASVFSGVLPPKHGVRHLFKEKINPELPTIAKTYKEIGYSTAAFVSCPGMNAWYGFNSGFDIYDDEIPKLADGSDPLQSVDVKLRGTALKRANVVVERALKWLEINKENNFFLFIHFFDAHWPYEAPEKFGGSNNYEEEVAYMDHYLFQFLKQFRQWGLEDNTTIVAFSDHGEDLEGLYQNDKGGKMGNHPEEFGHGCLLYDQTQKTVLIIADKTLPQSHSIDNQVRLIDIFPTLLDIHGINKDFSTDGISLMTMISGKTDTQLPGYSETFYPEEKKPRGSEKNKISYRIDNKYKLIINDPDNDSEFELYDLEKDPHELNNLITP